MCKDLIFKIILKTLCEFIFVFRFAPKNQVNYIFVDLNLHESHPWSPKSCHKKMEILEHQEKVKVTISLPENMSAREARVALLLVGEAPSPSQRPLMLIILNNNTVIGIRRESRIFGKIGLNNIISLTQEEIRILPHWTLSLSRSVAPKQWRTATNTRKQVQHCLML
jgi:hypothetical protein